MAISHNIMCHFSLTFFSMCKKTPKRHSLPPFSQHPKMNSLTFAICLNCSKKSIFDFCPNIQKDNAIKRVWNRIVKKSTNTRSKQVAVIACILMLRFRFYYFCLKLQSFPDKCCLFVLSLSTQSISET